MTTFDPDHTVDLPTLRERLRELRAEYNAVRARIHEIRAIADSEEMRVHGPVNRVPGPNAHVEGEDVPEEEGEDGLDAEHP